MRRGDVGLGSWPKEGGQEEVLRGSPGEPAPRVLVLRRVSKIAVDIIKTLTSTAVYTQTLRSKIPQA